MGTTACFTAYAARLHNKPPQQKTISSSLLGFSSFVHHILTENLRDVLGTQNKQTQSLSV